MSNVTKIPPLRAGLICLNSMIGAGLFINAKPLTILAGSFGFLGPIIGAIILLPLILCVAEFAAKYPVAGGFYTYSAKHIGAWAGFLSSWGYFLGKTTSVAILVHKFVEFFYIRMPLINQIPLLGLDCAVLIFLAAINIIGASVGGRVQYFFTILKITPIIFALIAGSCYFNPANFTDILALHDMLNIMPIAVFALLGFGVICAVGNQVENPQRNIRRIILTTFVITTLIGAGFQLITFGSLGHTLSTINNPILAIGNKLLGSNISIISQIFNGMVFASIIGASFSIMTSNCWNLHTIAYNGHFPAASLLTRINKKNVPWASLCVEVLLSCIILFITIDQIPLQNMAVFAQVFSYLVTTFAAFLAVHNGVLKKVSIIVPTLAIATCFIIIGLCLQRIILFGVSTGFLSLFLIGVIASIFKHCTSGRTLL